jgi:hypothetical protein
MYLLAASDEAPIRTAMSETVGRWVVLRIAITACV